MILFITKKLNFLNTWSKYSDTHVKTICEHFINNIISIKVIG